MTFTTSPYVRSHGSEPRGRGSWAFQAASSQTAFDDERRGDVVFFNGTFAQARREARRHFAGEEFVAVMP